MHKIHVIRLYFSMHALHVSDYISPSSGASFYELYIALGIRRYVWLLCGYGKDAVKLVKLIIHWLIYVLYFYRGCFPRGKAAVEWRWPFTSYTTDLRIRTHILVLPVPFLHSAWLHGVYKDNFTFNHVRFTEDTLRNCMCIGGLSSND